MQKKQRLRERRPMKERAGETEAGEGGGGLESE
jgi:hypothetical protein